MTDAQALFERGHAALLADDFREAVECLSRAIDLQPRAVAGYRHRARAFLGLGDRPRAVIDLDAAVGLQPADPQLRAERAELLLKQRRFDAAVADCDAALALDPARADLFAIRGRCHAETGDAAAALADFATAGRLDPDAAGRYRVQRAALFLELGDLPAALTDADAAVRADPESAAGYEARATARQRLGDREAAADDFAAAVERDPGSGYARLGLGQALFDLGRFGEALQAVAGMPPRPAVIELRGRCRERLGDPDGAVTEYTTLIELQPRKSFGYALRGYLLAGRGDRAAAVRDLLTAAEFSPDDAGPWNQLAWLWATSPSNDLRRPDRAIECATRACEQTGWREPGYLDTLAAAHAAAGQFDVAIRWLDEAMRLNPADEYRERLELYRRGEMYREGA